MPTGSLSPSMGERPERNGMAARFSKKKFAYLKNNKDDKLSISDTARYFLAFFWSVSLYFAMKKPNTYAVNIENSISSI